MHVELQVWWMNLSARQKLRRAEKKGKKKGLKIRLVEWENHLSLKQTQTQAQPCKIICKWYKHTTL